MVKFLFFFSLFIILYSYIGYGLLIFLIVKVKRLFSRKAIPPTANRQPSTISHQPSTVNRQPSTDFEPEVSLVVAAYNEEDFIERKIKNSLEI